MAVILELTRIVRAAAEAETPSEQVTLIVDAIFAAMDIDACSLYLANDIGEMHLVASHGLGKAAVGKASLPPGTGLVGRVAQTRHPVNVADAASHPAFHYVAGSREEKFQSFCGVPLVRGGDVVGVLVAQSKKARLLSEEEEAFLVTLGLQLALVVADWANWQALGINDTRTINGVRGAPGIAVGEIYLCSDIDLFSVADGHTDDPESTLADWRHLVQQVRAEVKGEQASLAMELSREVGAIFDAYQMLLSDPALLAGVEQAITRGHNLPAALKIVIHHYAELFLAMEDPYLRARHEDIRHLGNKLYTAWRNLHSNEPDSQITRPVILTGTQVSISDIAAVPSELLAGVVCFRGSTLSHTAVLANALGIPAVMGVGELRSIFNGEPIIVDGNQAQVIIQPAASVRTEYRRLAAAEKQLRGRLQHLRELPAEMLDGERIRLFANSGLLADLSPGLASGAEGLGLYRTEIPFMVSDTFPSEEEQVSTYRQVFSTYPQQPVYLRILDIGGDKPLPYFPITEENPALGWRGIRFCLDNISLLMTQVRAMLRAAAGHPAFHMMVPMVSATRELDKFHTIVDDALSQLRDEGIQVARPRIGIMVEVPAATSQLPLWRDKLDFVSIGSNDLSQYLLAVDRNNPRVSSSYDHLHPAVLHEIERIVASARELQLPLSLCGEMSSDPAAVVLLAGMGIRTLSMSAAHLPRIKWLIRHLALADARRLLGQALQLPDSTSIRALLDNHLEKLESPFDASASTAKFPKPVN
tara:strand:+ start:2418 stop:4691 length:2274 start_codon:yes stop_codon:yes gene_type:complete